MCFIEKNAPQPNATENIIQLEHFVNVHAASMFALKFNSYVKKVAPSPCIKKLEVMCAHHIPQQVQYILFPRYLTVQDPCLSPQYNLFMPGIYAGRRKKAM